MGRSCEGSTGLRAVVVSGLVKTLQPPGEAQSKGQPAATRFCAHVAECFKHLATGCKSMPSTWSTASSSCAHKLNLLQTLLSPWSDPQVPNGRRLGPVTWVTYEQRAERKDDAKARLCAGEERGTGGTPVWTHTYGPSKCVSLKVWWTFSECPDLSPLN